MREFRERRSNRVFQPLARVPLRPHRQLPPPAAARTGSSAAPRGGPGPGAPGQCGAAVPRAAGERPMAAAPRCRCPAGGGPGPPRRLPSPQRAVRQRGRRHRCPAERPGRRRQVCPRPDGGRGAAAQPAASAGRESCVPGAARPAPAGRRVRVPALSLAAGEGAARLRAALPQRRAEDTQKPEPGKLEAKAGGLAWRSWSCCFPLGAFAAAFPSLRLGPRGRPQVQPQWG